MDNDITVGIITHKRTDILTKSWALHEKFTHYPILVVDNSCNTETQQWLEQNKLKNMVNYIHEENIGFASAVNLLFNLVETAYIVILNPDVYVDMEYIDKLVKTHLRHAHNKIGILGCQLKDMRGTIYHNGIANCLREDGLYEPVNMGNVQWKGKPYDLAVDGVSFAVALMDRNIFKKYQLDESYSLGYYEDADFCNQVRQVGYTVWSTPKVCLQHELHASWDTRPKWEMIRLARKNLKYYNEKWKCTGLLGD